MVMFRRLQWHIPTKTPVKLRTPLRGSVQSATGLDLFHFKIVLEGCYIYSDVPWRSLRCMHGWKSISLYANINSLDRMLSRHHFGPCKWAASRQNQQNGSAPSDDSDQPGHPPSLIRDFAVRMKKAWVLSIPLSAQRRLWSDWADAQADLRLRWAHSHCVGFVMRRLKLRHWSVSLLPLCINTAGSTSLRKLRKGRLHSEETLATGIWILHSSSEAPESSEKLL